MPKFGMEPIRRQAMIEATISEVGLAGSLDITVSQIARRAGMSPALAHHYFGSKDQIFIAAMRHILTVFGQNVRRRLEIAHSPQDRIMAIVESSFATDQFAREIVAAWLAFYVRALHSPSAKRLLDVYARRLSSNLRYDLKKIFDPETAEKVGQGLASLIDGFYIRHALQDRTPSGEEITELVGDYLTLWIEREGRGQKERDGYVC